MRAWLSVIVCVGLVSVVGCGGDSRASLIDNTTNQMSKLTSALNNIKERVTEFTKKKEAGKEEEATKELNEAKASAEQIEQIAKQWQQAIGHQATAKAVSAEEQADLAKKNQDRIGQTRIQLIDAHRDMKKAVADANKRYEDAMRPLMQALSKAEGEVSVVVRKK